MRDERKTNTPAATPASYVADTYWRYIEEVTDDCLEAHERGRRAGAPRTQAGRARDHLYQVSGLGGQAATSPGLGGPPAGVRTLARLDAYDYVLARRIA